MNVTYAHKAALTFIGYFTSIRPEIRTALADHGLRDACGESDP